MAIETYKFRLYPNDEQKVLLEKHFGSVRFVYNWALERCQELYKTDKKFPGWMGIVGSGDFIKLKEDNHWLYEINSQSIVNSIAHLGKAFDGFFKNKGGYPKFKSKFENRQSFEVPSGLKIDFRKRKIQIPKFLNKKGVDNRIKFVLSRKVARGKFGTATISRNPANEYYISFIVHTQDSYPKFNKTISESNSLGMDFGLKHFLTLSDGRVIDSPEYFKRGLTDLAKKQKEFSRKKKGSKNREKQRIKLAKAHLHIANQREDFLHKLTTSLVEENQFDVFCLEDLNLKGMQKLWGRKVSDLSYYTFQSMLQYKAIKHGKKVVKIGRFEPSSQICSKCGHRQKLSLKERTYHCPACGTTIDRDLNAAINIRDFAIRRFLEKDFSTDGTSGINACGVDASGTAGNNPAILSTDGEAEKFSSELENPNHL